MKRILHITLWSVMILGVLILLGFTQNRHDAREVREVITRISYLDNARSDILITYKDVDNFLAHQFDSLSEKTLGDINIEEIEDALSEMDYVKEVEAYMNMDGDLHIALSQRRPVIRIMSSSGESYYLDNYGKVMPVRTGYPGKLIICNGFTGYSIYRPDHDSLVIAKDQDYELLNERIRDVYDLALAIDQNEFLKTQITQIFITPGGEFELIPLVGDHTIIFGDISRYEQKLMYLEAFYRQETTNLGWTQYKSINLKFKNQVVCTKK